MFRTSDMVLIGVMVAAAAFTYKTKQQAEGDLAAVHRLEAQIKLEEDTIDLLKADWSLLTQPSRLQKLVEAYTGDLKLQTTDARQYGAVRDIPARPLDIRDIIGDSGSLIAGTETMEPADEMGQAEQKDKIGKAGHTDKIGKMAKTAKTDKTKTGAVR